MKSFIQKCVDDEEDSAKIDLYIEFWHLNSAETQPLHKFLGFTWEDYKIWVSYPSGLSRLIEILKNEKLNASTSD